MAGGHISDGIARWQETPRRLARAVLAAAVLVGLVTAAASPASAADPTLTIRRLDASAWPEVAVTVLYTGETPDLRSFVVRQNGAIVPSETISIEPLEKARTKVGVVLAIDTSGSMEGEKLVKAKAAARRFVETKGAEHHIAVVAFSDASRVMSGLSTDPAGALAAIDALEARGETALWDGVTRSATLLAQQPDLLPYIVLLSDGANSVATGSRESATAAVRAAGAPVFAVGLRGGGGEFDAAGLAHLASATAGTYEEAASANDLDRLYGEVQGVLENQYELRWTSPAEAETVDVSVTVAGARAAASTAVNSAVVAPPEPAVVKDSLALPFPGGTIGMAGLAVLVAAAVAGIGVAVVSIARPGEKGLEQIVAEHTGQGVAREVDATRSGIAQLEVSQAVGKMIDAVAARAGGADVMERLDKRLDQADIKVQAQEAVLIASLVIVVAFGAGLAVGGPLIGLATAIIGGLLPAAALNFRAERRQKAFVNQLPDTLNLLASSLRAGFSLLQGLEAVSQEVDAPMGGELRRIVLETRLGRPLEEALEETAQRMASPDFEWVVIAIGIQRDVGGNLAELLTTVADTMVAREQLRREVSALTAEGRLSAIVIGIMPPALAVTISVLNPGYLNPLITSSTGKMLVLGAAVLAAVGFVWMRNTIKVDV